MKAFRIAGARHLHVGASCSYHAVSGLAELAELADSAALSRVRHRLCTPFHKGNRARDRPLRLRVLRRHSRPYSVDVAQKSGRGPPPFAFAFDIDGVLLHVAKPIPGATETLQYLQRNKIPFILLTNGGGKHEKERVAELSSRLEVELSTDNFVQSHTPFQELVHGPKHQGAQQGPGPGPGAGEGLADKTVLVTGSNAAKARTIAEQYGFRHVVTPADVLAAHPTIWPFEPLMKEVYAATARPLPGPHPQQKPLQIAAILVFDDPRDWALDSQLIVDLLLSRQGVLGTYSARNGRPDLPDAGWQSDGQPAVYYSNPDLFWSASYALPRFGQGAFQAAVAGVWASVTGGRPLRHVTTMGKPCRLTYAYAERVLNSHRAKLLRPAAGAGAGAGAGAASAAAAAAAAAADGDGVAALERVYMVGDNPESDIRGANEFQSPGRTSWTSILVRTGVWSAERGEPAYAPKVIVDDVSEAVRWALKQEGWR